MGARKQKYITLELVEASALNPCISEPRIISTPLPGFK
jgi:hypothetical protein